MFPTAYTMDRAIMVLFQRKEGRKEGEVSVHVSVGVSVCA